jgi:hypothetical protein
MLQKLPVIAVRTVQAVVVAAAFLAGESRARRHMKGNHFAILGRHFAGYVMMERQCRK